MVVGIQLIERGQANGARRRLVLRKYRRLAGLLFTGLGRSFSLLYDPTRPHPSCLPLASHSLHVAVTAGHKVYLVTEYTYPAWTIINYP